MSASPGPRTGLVARPVTISSPIGGVEYLRAGAPTEPLVVDCAFARALLDIAPVLRALGIEKLEYTSATSVRYVRRTKKLSGHAFGLALDIRAVHGPRGLVYTVSDDFERGMSRTNDCVGETERGPGILLRTLCCRLDESGLFRGVLSPDFDGDHEDHLHLEVKRPRAAKRQARSEKASRATP